MIPKTIHYCWFGGAPIGEKGERCLNSWRKFFPDYEIKRWDETNFDLDCCDYVREAAEENKWAFVSDYARFDILYRHGGIYFDTDVEVISHMDDIVSAGPFMACERDGGTAGDSAFSILVAPGLGLGTEAFNPIYKEILDGYRTRHFSLGDDGRNPFTVVKYVTNLLREHGLNDIGGVQVVDGIRIYPKEFFCPKDYYTGLIDITSNTRSIHHYEASWVSDSKRDEIAMLDWLTEHNVNFFLTRLLAKVASVVKHGDFDRLIRW